ncbi:flavin-containing monooxygenase [Trichodelitschia bisporula]|uniref:Flavin-containing monooxygenase n=1 Tax=Trichodelitschia bisporula TaxID=703511 RepID=A0A6G1IAF7_9PEZI|nr:flavin-containing monooxygenase [Trichodelitschia bisporula]
MATRSSQLISKDEILSQRLHFDVHKVAIIGAGPAGLAAAKYLKNEGAFQTIDVFEQRDDIGGVWGYTPESSGDHLFSVPQTDAHLGPEQPVWRTKHPINGQAADRLKQPVFLSPVYDLLETNIPRCLMGFSDLNFADDIPLFPKHSQVQSYLQNYAGDIRSLIKFRRQVLDVRPLHGASSDPTLIHAQWRVDSLDLDLGRNQTSIYDAVIVASGHYSVPYVPDIPGVRAWAERYPGAISHSKYYRRPEEFMGKRIVVVGSSASGLDIASQLAAVCQGTLFVAERSHSSLEAGFASNSVIQLVPEISKFIPENQSVLFANGSEAQVDHVLFCTGYLYSMPFLDKLKPPPISDGLRVKHTCLHLIYTPAPTLAFLALPQKVIPFPLSEAQAAVLARLYSGRLSLPSVEELESWEAAHIAQSSNGRSFHRLNFPKDAQYINMLYDWAASAEPREGLDHGGRGKLPKKWGEKEFWVRERFPAIRKAFLEHRKTFGCSPTSLVEIGFIFEGDHIADPSASETRPNDEGAL